MIPAMPRYFANTAVAVCALVLAAGAGTATSTSKSEPAAGARTATAMSCRSGWWEPQVAAGIRRAWVTGRHLPAGKLDVDLFGVCGSTWYALVGVNAPVGAPSTNLWRYQDGPHIFRGSSATQWTYVGDTGGDAPHCGPGRRQFPRALVRLVGQRCA